MTLQTSSSLSNLFFLVTCYSFSEGIKIESRAYSPGTKEEIEKNTRARVEAFLKKKNSFENIQSLALPFSLLGSFPKEVVFFSFLQDLNLTGNSLTILPREVCLLPNLVKLSVNSNYLGELPEEMGRLTHLKVLNASHNNLVKIPNSFRDLQNLTFLFLQANRIQVLSLEDLPPKCFSAVNGCFVNLSYNMLKDEILLAMKVLKRVNVDFNPYDRELKFDLLPLYHPHLIDRLNTDCDDDSKDILQVIPSDLTIKKLEEEPSKEEQIPPNYIKPEVFGEAEEVLVEFSLPESHLASRAGSVASSPALFPKPNSISSRTASFSSSLDFGQKSTDEDAREIVRKDRVTSLQPTHAHTPSLLLSPSFFQDRDPSAEGNLKRKASTNLLTESSKKLEWEES